jgi:hypothetical protein
VGGTDGRMGMSPHVVLRHDVGGWGVVKAMFGYNSQIFFKKDKCMQKVLNEIYLQNFFTTNPITVINR